MLIVALLFALTFEFINGFHDTANVVATSVATKALTPRQAIIIASITNLLGALVGTAVASTILSSIIVKEFASIETIIGALLGAITWNLLTWWKGIPSSSSHALIGSLVGSTLVASHGNLHAIIWNTITDSGAYKGILWSVALPMILSPLLGFFLSYLFIKIINCSVSASHKTTFRYLQIASASSIGFMHGLNDAQKTMGVITMCLSIALLSGEIPPSLQWLIHNTTFDTVPTWVKIICALTMAIGTAIGGWKIIKTMGFKIVKLTTREGFVAESASATTILICSLFGMPVSTTHNITASILGAGTGSHPEKVSYKIVYKILMAWVMTLPCAAGFGALFAMLLR